MMGLRREAPKGPKGKRTGSAPVGMGEKLGALAAETYQIAMDQTSLCELGARLSQVRQAAFSNPARAKRQGNGLAVEGSPHMACSAFWGIRQLVKVRYPCQ